MRTLWLQTDSALNGGQFLIDFDTRKAPVIAEGNPLRIELGAFTSGLPADLGDYTSLNLSIYASRFDIDGAPLVTEDLPAADITDTITTSAWNSRLASNATFEISGATLSFDLGSDTSKKLFMVVSALTSETETVLGASEVTVFADQNPRRAGLGFQSDWLTATTYLKGDLVKRSDTVYIALVKHTSGTSSAPGTGADWGDYWEIFVERGAPGDDGNVGNDGNDGWSPVFSINSDSARRVLRVVDWVGGEGTKPATGKYVGLYGLVDAIGDGVDIRGTTGATGPAGSNATGAPSGVAFVASDDNVDAHSAGTFIRADSYSGSVSLTLRPNADFAFPDNFHFWVQAITDLNPVILTRGSGVVTLYDGEGPSNADIVLDTYVVYHVFRISSNVWMVIARS